MTRLAPYLASTPKTTASSTTTRYDYEKVALPFFADLGEAVARELWGLPAVDN